MIVYLVTDATGFPYGTAAVKRIEMIIKALKASDNDFLIYTNSLIPNNLNKTVKGLWQGTEFEYLHGTTVIPSNKLFKLFLYIKGIFRLIKLLLKIDKKNSVVYIYSQGTMFNVFTLLFCKALNINTVEEINEWYHNEPGKKLIKLITEGPMVKWPKGALVISEDIKNKVLAINPKLDTLILPVLEDKSKYTNSLHINREHIYCFWMGLVDSYIKDILFIIDSYYLNYKQGIDYHIYISGPYSEVSKNKINNHLNKYGIPEGRVNLLGYLDYSTLESYYKSATFYILPLWNDERSRNRFPTKLASFMFTGNPIISCGIGEVGRLFSDKKDILFYESESSNDLANKIALLLSNSELYNNISKNSQISASLILDYRNYVGQLNEFFQKYI